MKNIPLKIKGGLNSLKLWIWFGFESQTYIVKCQIETNVLKYMNLIFMVEKWWWSIFNFFYLGI